MIDSRLPDPGRVGWMVSKSVSERSELVIQPSHQGEKVASPNQIYHRGPREEKGELGGPYCWERAQNGVVKLG